jgi:hypothetical protein
LTKISANQREIPGNGIDDDQNGYVMTFTDMTSSPMTVIRSTIITMAPMFRDYRRWGNKTASGVCWEVSLMGQRLMNWGWRDEQCHRGIQHDRERGQSDQRKLGRDDKSQALEEVINEAQQGSPSRRPERNTDAPSTCRAQQRRSCRRD